MDWPIRSALPGSTGPSPPISTNPASPSCCTKWKPPPSPRPLRPPPPPPPRRSEFPRLTSHNCQSAPPVPFHTLVSHLPFTPSFSHLELRPADGPRINGIAPSPCGIIPQNQH